MTINHRARKRRNAINTNEALTCSESPLPDAKAAPPATGVSSPLEQLSAQLDAMRFSGQAGTLEAILARLDLPALHPETVVLVAPPLAGSTRLLSALADLIAGQQTPVAQVNCRPADQEVPYQVMVSLIRHFLSFTPRQTLEQRFTNLNRQYPWLGRLFPVLAYDTPTPLPENPLQWRRGLEALMLELTRQCPHIAVLRDFHFADQESLVTLSALQCSTGHGLRIIADVEQSNSLAVLHHLAKHNACVMVLQPFTPEEVLTYLRQALPDIAQPAVADALHEVTDGRCEAIECALIQWVREGILTREDGHWVYHPPAEPTRMDSRPAPAEKVAGGKGKPSLLLLFSVIALLLIGLFAVCPQHPPQTTPPVKVIEKINPVDSAEMVFIPAGDFQMGFTTQELSDIHRRHADWPEAHLAAQTAAHRVHVNGFWLYRYEVTVSQYRQFCWMTGRPEPAGAHDLPITNVTWTDAAAYCKWAGGQLPSEAEWEYAARGTDGRRYPWGNDWDARQWSYGNTLLPAGSQPLNISPFGIHDLGGNVSEWCEDTIAATPPPGTPAAAARFAITMRMPSPPPCAAPARKATNRMIWAFAV